MTLALKRIDSRSDISAPVEGVIKAAVLASVQGAQSLMERARLEADRLLREARLRGDALADDIVRDRERDLLERQAGLDSQLWKRASTYARAVTGEWERCLAEVESSAASVVGSALSRLIDQAPSRERLLGCVNALLKDSARPDTGALRVSTQDHDAVVAWGPRLPWPVQLGEDLPAGTVRLVSERGRWECDIHSALDTLLEALGAQADQAPASASAEPFNRR